MRLSAIDIGSSATKSCVFEIESPGQIQLHEHQSIDCPLLRSQENHIEHNLENHLRALRDLMGRLPKNIPVGFTSAMHGLVLLDKDGRALTEGLSWADGRSFQQAYRLKMEHPGAHSRTGTPLHPMAWPAKILWIQEKRPELWRRTRKLTDLKSYLLKDFTEQNYALDISSASGTGLWNHDEKTWDQELVNALSLNSETLPEVHLESFAWNWEGRKLHLGGGDGPLGNLGTGAVGLGRTALSLGTSGACRSFTETLRPLPQELFRYHLNRASWVEGGAISNGSSVLDWLAQREAHTPEQILQLASAVEPGAKGLRVYPYFQGERAPFWRANVQAQIRPQHKEHNFAELARATIEGVGFCLQRVLSFMPASQEALRCTGGMFGSKIWCQLLADITGSEIAVSPVTQATSLGAALLCLPEHLALSRELPLGTVVEPREKQHLIYRELYQNWVRLDEASSPSKT